MSLLFFDWCRRLAFRDAIQKFCPFPVFFLFFFLVAWRSSLFALKKILYMSFNSCGRNIMSYGRMKKCFAPDSGMQDSDLWESPHCREILWRPSIGRSWAHGCARQLLSNFWRFEFLYFWAIFAHNIALEHIFSTESQRFIQISQIFINLLNT